MDYKLIYQILASFINFLIADFNIIYSTVFFRFSSVFSILITDLNFIYSNHLLAGNILFNLFFLVFNRQPVPFCLETYFLATYLEFLFFIPLLYCYKIPRHHKLSLLSDRVLHISTCFHHPIAGYLFSIFTIIYISDK